MKRFGLIATLTYLLFTSCTNEYNDYYYDKENLHWFICYSDHYVVAKDLGDSLQIWNLVHHCNSGYGASEDIRIAKKVGTTAKTENFKFRIEITEVNDRRIELKLNSGGQVMSPARFLSYYRRKQWEETQKIIKGLAGD